MTKTYTLKISVDSKGESEVRVSQMLENFKEDVRAAATRNTGAAELRLVSFEEQDG
jgi:hypothetical protein